MIAAQSAPLRISRARRFLRFARNVARWGIPPRSLLFGPLSLGDDLLCTAVLREAHRRGVPFAMMTARPELFEGNGDPIRLLPIDDDFVAGIRKLGARVIKPYYLGSDAKNPTRDLLPSRHIIAEMCKLAELKGDVAIRPYFHLTAAERAAGKLFPRQIAIQSSSLSAAIPYETKEWGADRFGQVSRQLGLTSNLVQLGSIQDPPLPVDVDLRGRTTLRQAAAILAASDLFIGLEGFLTHLARSVECPSVVIMGGRAPVGVFGYSANRNLAAFPECAPCALRCGCPHAMKCMAPITSDMVVEAAVALANRPRAPLSLDTIHLT